MRQPIPPPDYLSRECNTLLKSQRAQLAKPKPIGLFNSISARRALFMAERRVARQPHQYQRENAYQRDLCKKIPNPSHTYISQKRSTLRRSLFHRTVASSSSIVGIQLHSPPIDRPAQPHHDHRTIKEVIDQQLDQNLHQIYL